MWRRHSVTRPLLILNAAAVVAVICTAPIGSADELVTRPGESATGYIHMTPTEVAAEVDARIADGLVDADSLTRTPHRIVDPTTGIVLAEAGIILAGTPVDLLIRAGVLRAQYLDPDGTVRHYDDPYWQVCVETRWEATYRTGP